MIALNTLHRKWLLFLICSPSGRDKTEGAGCEKSFCNSLLERDDPGSMSAEGRPSPPRGIMSRGRGPPYRLGRAFLVAAG
jgi:hypothetical protein